MRGGCAVGLLLACGLLSRTTLAQTRAETAARAMAHYDLSGAAAWRAELPVDLAEVSGLAFTADGKLLAHGDEQAIVWRFDLSTRRVVARFALGDRGRVLIGDFEDIAVAGERLFLVTAEGVVYEGRIAPHGQTGQAARRTPGLGGGCEVEGMTWDESTRSLLLLCKTTRSKRWKNQVVILAVSTETWRFEPEPRILVDEARLEQVTGAKGFNGSALARHPRTGTYLLLAGPQQAYAEVNAAGDLLAGGRLDKARHRQPEGIAIAPDLTLLISDEAAGHDAAITAYAYRP